MIQLNFPHLGEVGGELPCSPPGRGITYLDLDYHGYFSLESWVSDSMIGPKPLAPWDLL